MAVKKLLSVFLSFLLLLSFTGTLAQAEETASMSVEKAIQVFKQQGKTKGIVEGYIVGYTQSSSKYTKDPAGYKMYNRQDATIVDRNFEDAAFG
ncbi:hypothetical protein N3930_36095, partial [Bacillus thuringiensis]|nr:hypothetical protein [Bacillus thuringiensis]